MSSFYGNGGGKGGSSDTQSVIIEYGRVVTNDNGTFIELKVQNVLEPLMINVGSLIDIYNGEANAKQIQITVDNSLNTIAAAIVKGSVGTIEIANGSITEEKLSEALIKLIKEGAIKVDKTLKIEGAAADAKTVGDLFDSAVFWSEEEGDYLTLKTSNITVDDESSPYMNKDVNEVIKDLLDKIANTSSEQYWEGI